MADGGFFETRRRISPTGLTIVILLHGAAITALALSKMEVIGPTVIPPTTIYDVFDPPEPEPIPDPPKQPEVKPKSQVDYVKPIVPPLPRQSDPVVVQPRDNVVIFDPRPIGRDEPAPVPPKPIPAPPAPTPAKMRSGDLQPPYPPALEASQTEGKVAVRITIGADGRVKAVEKVSATHDAFFRATERHARRAWRFTPATRDGKPVESRQVITVDFQLAG